MAGTVVGVSLRSGTGAVAIGGQDCGSQPCLDVCPPALVTAIEAGIAEGRSFAVALLDVDDFSLVGGGATLPAEEMTAIVSRVIASAVLPHETAVRLGGDFALVLDTRHAPAALRLAEDLRQAVEETLWDAGAVTVTVCCGVAMWHPDESADGDDLLGRVDQALAVARAGGQNRVILAGTADGEDPGDDRVGSTVTRPGEIRDLLYLCSSSGHLRARLRTVAEELGLIAIEDDGALVLTLLEGTALLETVAERWRAVELRQVLARTTSSSSGGAGVTMPAVELLRRLATPWLPRLLSERALRPVLQPIRALSDGACVGQEALMRGHLDGVTYSATEIMAAARAHDLLFAMDAIAWTAALDHGLSRLAGVERLHVNLLLPALDNVDAYLHTVDTLARRCDLSRVVIEITEPEASTLPEQHDVLAAAHQRFGAGVALDRVGAGVHSLRRISQLRPEMVKLDRELTHNLVESDPRIGLIRAVADHARSCGARVVAVGIETVAECVVLRELGVDLGQGDYLGRPQ